MILKREARIDGNNDPINPITPPKINAKIIKSNVTRKLNAISLNVTQFDVPVETKFNGNASTIPIAAPMHATVSVDKDRVDCLVDRALQRDALSGSKTVEFDEFRTNNRALKEFVVACGRQI